jgi:activator of HSP90 ATPase
MYFMKQLETISVADILPAAPERVYNAWLSSSEHGLFTGTTCTIEPAEGGKFVAGDGYMHGITKTLEPFRRIIQTWKSTEFPEDSEYSLLEIILEPSGNNTRITLNHSNIPAGQGESYKQGWIDYYFEPMKEYFTENAK